jgi:hypothetical protein
MQLRSVHVIYLSEWCGMTRQLRRLKCAAVTNGIYDIKIHHNGLKQSPSSGTVVYFRVYYRSIRMVQYV